MNTVRQKTRIAIPFVAIVVFILLYLGSYYLLLQPRIMYAVPNSGLAIKGSIEWTSYPVAPTLLPVNQLDFRIGGSWSYVLLYPAHWIDRQVRPNFWVSPPENHTVVDLAPTIYVSP